MESKSSATPLDAPETSPASNRARRALPLIAAALAATVIAGLVYLRPQLPTLPAPAAQQSSAPSILEQRYEADYDFVSPAVGWGLIDDVIGARYWVFGTTDGARTWTLERSDTYKVSASSHIRFFDARNGYISIGGGQTLRTTDGGRHWNQVTLPSSAVAQVWFVDRLHGWFHSFTDFEYTSDGGAAWLTLPSPPVAGPLMDFADANNGWLASIDDNATGVLYSTHDGGANWTAHPLPGDQQQSRPAASLLALPGGGVLVSLLDETAYTSFDDGDSWTLLPPPPPGNSYGTVAIQDQARWWAMDQGDLYKTFDAGRTWQHVAVQLDGWRYIPQVLDSKHAWATLESSGPPNSGSSLAATSDGGIHWTYVSVPRVS